MSDNDTGEEHVEVEVKFAIPEGGTDRLREMVRDLGGSRWQPVEQVDTYFAHPVRDFAATDEALRVRLVGDEGCVTYKGPLLDRKTKSREETELAFAGGASDAARFAGMLGKLGFTPVRDVRKTREPWRLTWNGCAVEVALDSVCGLGDFVEIETSSTREDFAAARRVILDLAARLDLHNPERRSYLALLLDRHEHAAQASDDRKANASK